MRGVEGGGGVRHLEVVFVSPGRMIRFAGGLGTLQAAGLAGSMTWSLAEGKSSTNLILTYMAGGYYDGKLRDTAPVVDSVLEGQMNRLKNYLENGRPDRDNRS